MKYVIVLGDGMADEPIETLGGKTIIEAADTPNMDMISKKAEIGLVHTIPEGMKPGSDTANLSVLGYDPEKYYSGRSPLEALSIGVDMKSTDIAIRCNIVTLSDDDLPYEEKTITDHSSSEISTEDADVLIEEFIDGVFVTVGVLEKDGKNFATEILEIRPKNEWYDYEAKYTPGMSDFILPANMSPELTAQTKAIAIKAHEAAGCRGVSRVDFMISKDGIPYVIEINTSPGMTETSDLPAQSAVMGINYDNLVQIILNSVGLDK